jgi:hypothetical protein
MDPLTNNRYIYQPAKSSLSYQASVQLLRDRGLEVVERWKDKAYPDSLARTLFLAEQCGWVVKPLEINITDYNEYYHRAEYQPRYPEYYTGNLPEKSLEHFLSLTLLGLREQDVFVDLASESSPLPEIVSRLYGCKCYSQDIMYPEGILGNQIGGDACAMPVMDGFFTRAALTCSLEHFEGRADCQLFVELSRVLVPGGKVCVVPFYLYHTSAVMTDPTYSTVNEVPFDSDARVIAIKGWNNRHGRFYSPNSFMERIAMPLADVFSFEYYLITNACDIHPANYVRFALVATRR